MIHLPSFALGVFAAFAISTLVIGALVLRVWLEDRRAQRTDIIDLAVERRRRAG